MYKINRAYNTLLEMLEHRGYTHIDDETNIAENENGDKVIIFILPFGKLTIDQIKNYISQTHIYSVQHCIILIQEVTPIAKKYLFEIPNMNCELFFMLDLQYNLTKHCLVPKHIKLNEKQVSHLRKQFQIKHLPVLQLNDPVSRFNDFQIGDVIRIERDSDIVYRIVK